MPCHIQSLIYLATLSLLSACNGQLRDLAGVRYHLTPCESSGRMGPTDQQCFDYYREKGSNVARDNLIRLQTKPALFRGGQLVRIPRTALYNVTVAGATGGRGLCSPLYGRGLIIKAQAQFREGLQMLVLAGQKGHGPCEFKDPPTDSICSNISENNATKCNETWWNLLLNSVGESEGLDVFGCSGGGGGGGTSMIRLENDEGLQVFPYIVSGGGGGGAAVLDLDFIDTVRFTHSENATQADIYQMFMDGKIDSFDPVISDREALRGFSIADDCKAGAGGGYISDEDSRRVDGSQLIFEDSFAEGGSECSKSSFVPTTLTPEVGGFGAGGGGCGGGGGGGGHTGGAIVAAGNFVPGGGGYSFTVEGSMAPTILEYGLNSEGDGYVDIVAADCGCVYDCIVYEEEDQFECLCPNNTHLAPDMNDCYHTEMRQVEQSEWDLNIGGGYKFSLVDFGNATNIFSISALLTEDIGASSTGRSESTAMSSRNDLLCTIAFIGADEDIVLISAPVQDVYGIVVNRLSKIQINFTEGHVLVSEPTDFLSSAVLVTGALLISQGDCFIQKEISMNVSITKETSKSELDVFGYPNLRAALLENPDVTISVLARILQNENKSQPTVDTDISEIVLISVVAGFVILLIISTLLCLCICCYRHKRPEKIFPETRVASRPSSMINNGVYVAYRSSQKSVVGADTRYASCRSPSQGAYETAGHLNEKSPGVLPPDLNFFDFNASRCKSSFYDSEWQYPRNQLSFMRDLGEGQFGKVLLMKAQQGIAGYKGELPVAVKTLSSREPEMVARFMEEAELMKKFSHPNIVSLLGVSTNDVCDDDNAPLMILEYMPYGDLHKFLKKNKPNSQTPQVPQIDTYFTNFAIDVAKALEFIAQLKYVHRDIAARNCLVGTGLRIKIADFGLARKMNSQHCVEIEGGCVLPIRTMAPECFTSGQFTVATDVWSYGVLLWEIVSYGALPLEGVSSKVIAERAHKRQLLHVIPSECPPVLSSLISQCHVHDPDQRPSFTEILEKLTPKY